MTKNVIATRTEMHRSYFNLLKAYLIAVQRQSDAKRSIRQLQHLDDRMLKDMGIAREDAMRVKPRPLKHYVD